LPATAASARASLQLLLPLLLLLLLLPLLLPYGQLRTERGRARPGRRPLLLLLLPVWVGALLLTPLLQLLLLLGWLPPQPMQPLKALAPRGAAAAAAALLHLGRRSRVCWVAAVLWGGLQACLAPFQLSLPCKGGTRRVRESTQGT